MRSSCVGIPSLFLERLHASNLMDLVTVPAPLHFKIFYQYLHSKPLLLNPVDFFSVVFLIDINNNYIPLQVKLKEKMRALPSPDVSLMMCLS